MRIQRRNGSSLKLVDESSQFVFAESSSLYCFSDVFEDVVFNLNVQHSRN